jgi:outer membrane protein TolC
MKFWSSVDRPATIWLFEDLFQVAYEVDLFGRVHRAIEEANANAESVRAARDSVRVVVAAETARSYAAVCALGEQIAVSRRSLEVVSHEAEITEKRYQAGANSVFDVTRAQALVAQVRAGIPTLEGQRRAALFELTALLGRTPSEAPKELDGCVTPPQLSALIPVGDGATSDKTSSRRAAGRASPGRCDGADRGGHGGSIPHHSIGGALWGRRNSIFVVGNERGSHLGYRPVDQLVISQYGCASRSRP